MKILVLLNGTVVLVNNRVLNLAGMDQLQQLPGASDFFHDLNTHLPAGKSVDKLRVWKNQGADVLYLSSRENFKRVEMDRFLLKYWGFPEGPVFFRNRGETFQDIVEKIVPDILIENDCYSSGGEKAMISACLPAHIRQAIKVIVVKENQGIDHLPDNVSELKNF